jgi:hypothetical protein
MMSGKMRDMGGMMGDVGLLGSSLFVALLLPSAARPKHLTRRG